MNSEPTDLKIPDDKVVEALRHLQENIKATIIDTDFGAFGVISRMNTNFKVLKHIYSAKRRKSTNEKVRNTLRAIAIDAVIAETLL